MPALARKVCGWFTLELDGRKAWRSHLSQVGEWRLSPDVTVTVNRGPLTSSSVRVATQASLKGLGISYFPRFLVEEEIKEGKLIVLLPEIVDERIPLYVMFPKGSYMLSKVRAFVDFLVEQISGTGEHRNFARIGLAAAG